MGSGPTAAAAPLAIARGIARVVVVNNSWQLAPWADCLYASDFPWWERFQGVPEFGGLKLCQDIKVKMPPNTRWGVRFVEVNRTADRILVSKFGEIGWGGNSGFGALNLVAQFGVRGIAMVGFDCRIDKGRHWHADHPMMLNNPTEKTVARWRRVLDEAAPTFRALGIDVVNTSPVSALENYPKVTLEEWLGLKQERAA